MYALDQKDAQQLAEVRRLGETQARMEKTLGSMSGAQTAMAATLEEVRRHLAELSSASLTSPRARLATSPRELDGVEIDNMSENGEIVAVDRPDRRCLTSASGISSRSQDRVQKVTTGSTVGPRPTSTQNSKGFVAPTLPNFWPSTLEARQGLEVDANNMVMHTSVGGITRKSTGGSVSMYFDNGSSSRTFWSKLRDPNWFPHVIFDLIGLLILIYDLTAVPIVLAWDLEPTGVLFVMTLVSASFWTLDIFVSFNKGFYRGGVLISDRRTIARRYVRTWFFADSMLVISDWVNLIMKSSGEMKLLRFIKAAKAVRIFALVKLFRAAKFAKIVTNLMQVTYLANFSLALKCGVLIFGTVWVNHFLCCLWWAIGTWSPTDTGKRWTEDVIIIDGVATSYRELNHRFQYWTAMHWSIAQATLGAMEVSPVNTVERIFTVVCLVIGLLVGSTMISTLSASMVDIQMMHKEQTKQLRTLKKYLEENAVAGQLALTVQRQVQERLGQRDRLTRDDVPALGLLSRTLGEDLHACIVTRHLLLHPMMRTLYCVCPVWFRQFCAKAVEVIFPRSSDDIFLGGHEADRAYYLCNGSVLYIQDEDTFPQNLSETESMVGSWFSESALWSHWIHVGTAKATIDSQLVTVIADKIPQVVLGHRTIANIVGEYARIFHSRIVAAGPPAASWPTDLDVPFTDFGDIVCMMPKPMRVLMAQVSIDTLEQRGRLFNFGGQRRSVEELMEEVSKGKSVVVMNGQGEAERVVTLAVLRLANDDKDVLVQLGNWEDGHATPDCALPAAKQKLNEATNDSYLRLLSTKLSPFVGMVQLEHINQEVVQQHSQKFGICTKYLRKVCSSRLSSPVSLARCQVAKVQSREEYVAHMAHMEPAHSRLEEFLQLPVHLLFSNGEGKFYAWLQQSDFEYLTSSAGKADLQHWLAALHPPPEGQEPDDATSVDDVEIPEEKNPREEFRKPS